MKWQPIETAPKCGRSILLLREKEGPMERGCYEFNISKGSWSAKSFPDLPHVWIDDCNFNDDPTDEEWEEYEGWGKVNKPKYWCELPEPPEGYIDA